MNALVENMLYAIKEGSSPKAGDMLLSTLMLDQRPEILQSIEAGVPALVSAAFNVPASLQFTRTNTHQDPSDLMAIIILAFALGGSGQPLRGQYKTRRLELKYLGDHQRFLILDTDMRRIGDLRLKAVADGREDISQFIAAEQAAIGRMLEALNQAQASGDAWIREQEIQAEERESESNAISLVQRVFGLIYNSPDVAGDVIIETLMRPHQVKSPDADAKAIAKELMGFRAAYANVPDELTCRSAYADEELRIEDRGDWERDTLVHLIIFAYVLGSKIQNLSGPFRGREHDFQYYAAIYAHDLYAAAERRLSTDRGWLSMKMNLDAMKAKFPDPATAREIRRRASLQNAGKEPHQIAELRAILAGDADPAMKLMAIDQLMNPEKSAKANRRVLGPKET